MSDRTKALREKRGKIVAEMRALTNTAETEKRDLSAEEAAKHAELFKAQDAVRANIDAEERQEQLDREEAEAAGKAAETRQKAEHGTVDDPAGTAETRAMTAFRGYLRNGKVSGEGAEELRALQAEADTEGGYLVAPQQFVSNLIQSMDDQVFIRARATKFTVEHAQSLGAPSLDTDVDDFDWTTELKSGSTDDALAFGKRELYPHPLAKRVKISKKLLRIATMPVDQIVMARLSYKASLTQEKAFLTGSGANQPLGLFTASDQGIPTSRDVATDNSATAPTFDGLREAKYSVKAQYWNKCDWLFHQDCVKILSKIKDDNGQYIWQASLVAGAPDTIMGRPLLMSQHVPNTFTAGNYVGMFGDFSHYWIADALDMQVQHLTELYAETNQDGFIGRLECDGMPVLAEAFARVKLAAS